jgi:hypothetical protein
MLPLLATYILWSQCVPQFVLNFFCCMQITGPFSKKPFGQNLKQEKKHCVQEGIGASGQPKYTIDKFQIYTTTFRNFDSRWKAVTRRTYFMSTCGLWDILTKYSTNLTDTEKSCSLKTLLSFQQVVCDFTVAGRVVFEIFRQLDLQFYITNIRVYL